MRLVSALQVETMTSAQIAALATGTGRYPKGTVIFDSTQNAPVYNTGTDAAPTWTVVPVGYTSPIKNAAYLFSGKNNGSLTAITMNTQSYDDWGTLAWATNAYMTVPETGRYLFVGYAGTTGQSGSGGGNIDAQQLDGTGAFLDTIMTDQLPFNGTYSFSFFAALTAGQRVAFRTQNGATGSAGTVQGRVAITRVK